MQGLIARGNHFGSLVEKDRQRMLYDEQVTGFERAAPTNLSLPADPHSWPKVTKRTPRPNTLIPKSNGHQSTHRYVACPSCSTHFDIEGEMGFSKMFDHISYCGPKRWTWRSPYIYTQHSVSWSLHHYNCLVQLYLTDLDALFVS